MAVASILAVTLPIGIFQIFLGKIRVKIFWCNGLKCVPLQADYVQKHQLGAVRRHFWPSADDGCDRIN